MERMELWWEGEGTLFPRERQRQEDSVKTCNVFNVFSWLPRNRAHYPSKCGCCFLLFPAGTLADSPSCFLADSQSLPLTLCQANGWQPLWTVICFAGRAAGEGLFFSKSEETRGGQPDLEASGHCLQQGRTQIRNPDWCVALRAAFSGPKHLLALLLPSRISEGLRLSENLFTRLLSLLKLDTLRGVILISLKTLMEIFKH